MSSNPQPPQATVARGTAGRQDLNPIDRVMWCVDRALRGMGYPGFKTQMFVWLSGRADAERLRRDIARLSRQHPVIASRLVETEEHDDAEVYWRFRPDATCPLRETVLDSADRQTVLEHAGELLSQTNDPTQADPIDFHLLRRPDGRDVFLMQYNHMLMDNNATVAVLQRIHCLSQEADGEDVPSETRSPVRRFLRRVPYPARREAALQSIELQRRSLKGRAAVLGKAEEDAPREVNLRIATRELDAEASEALRARIVEICGFPSLSMGMLASVLRAIGRLAPHHRDEGRKFTAGIGLDLNVRNGPGTLFQNLMSLVPISVPGDDLDDREALIRLLSHQMRQRLTSRVDVGIIQLISHFSRRARYIRWAVEHLLRYGTSLWYAYFGSLDTVGREFCGAEIEDVFYTGPTWSPVGLTLLVNQYRGRLLFQATYDPQLVSSSLVDEFFGLVMDDLPK